VPHTCGAIPEFDMNLYIWCIEVHINSKCVVITGYTMETDIRLVADLDHPLTMLTITNRQLCHMKKVKLASSWFPKLLLKEYFISRDMLSLMFTPFAPVANF